MKKSWLCALILLVCLSPAGAQKAQINYDSYYRFPISFALEYGNLFPFQAYPEPYLIYEIAANLRWPIPVFPLLQPSLRAGMTQFVSNDPSGAKTWDHNRFFADAGVVLAHRFSKLIEVGLGVSGGYSHALFPNLYPSQGTVASPTLSFGGQGLVSLNPFYNLSISIHPSLRYLYSLSTLKRYDGLLWGIGASLHLRLGSDPDSAETKTRNIRFEETEIQPLFAAMQSYYVKNPVGSVKITNIDKQTIRDIEVSFYQSGYMDSPTPAASIQELGPAESRTVKFPAAFNAAVFEIEGVTPLTGEIVVSYFSSQGKSAEQRQPVTYDLHDKTALTWDDDRKVGAFITPADSIVRDHASFIRQANREAVIPALSEPLQVAMQVYEALAEMGILYQSDPTSPFTEVQKSKVVVDSISLPRDTLNRLTGDCDDLTVLYDTLLESAGVETAFVTTPGHIFAAVNTGVASREYGMVHPQRDMSLTVDGQLWVLVEITLMGRKDFLEAWRTGMEEFQRYEPQPKARGFYRTREAQTQFRPVGLKQKQVIIASGDEASIRKAFQKDLKGLTDLMIASSRRRAEESGDKKDYNSLGISAARLARSSEAIEAFNTVLRMDKSYLSARINLGSVYYLQKEYRKALDVFLEAERGLQQLQKSSTSNLVKVILNVSKSYYELAQYEKAQEYYSRALKLNETEAKQYTYLSSAAGAESGRASEAGQNESILFVTE